ncbi:hypothetical protein KQH40_00570 [bacterium]|nr:hypothetical protein [bacterium]
MQIEEHPTFGQLLKFHRRNTSLPKKGGALTQEKFAEIISEKIGYQIFRPKISDWENDKKTIHHIDERNILIAIIAALYKYKGIRSLTEANLLLEIGGYRMLNPREINQIADWVGTNLIEESPSQKVNDTAEFLQQTAQQAKADHPTGTISPALFLAPNLPQQGIFGRENDIQKIISLLVDDRSPSSSMQKIALLGMGGIGKTTLAIALAHQPEIRNTFPDGILWTSLGPKPTVRLIQEEWGRALGIDLYPERDEKACQTRLLDFLYSKRVLLIVDDVWDTIQGNYFQIAGSRSRLVFTTRESPIANDLVTKSNVLRVNVLHPSAAMALIQKLAPDAVRTNSQIVMKLCEKLEFLPLALTLAGRLLANEADIPSLMQRLIEEMIEHREARLQLLMSEGRLGIDEENPVSLQAILGMSVDRLDKTDQDRFAMLGVFGGEPLDWDINAVSYVWDCSMQQAEKTMSSFIQRGLVESRGRRYWMHALLADYAEEMRQDRNL